MATPNRTIKLQSNEGDIFDVDITSLQQSELLMVFSPTSDDDPISLTNINTTNLKKAIEWMEHHRNDVPQSEKDKDRIPRLDPINASDWNREFYNISMDSLFELILAANYLNIRGLLDETCKIVANMIKDKTPNEVHRMVNVKNDSTLSETTKTPEEKE